MSQGALQVLSVGAAYLLVLGHAGPWDVALALGLGLLLVGTLARRSRMDAAPARPGTVLAWLRLGAVLVWEIARGTLGVAAVVLGLRRAHPATVHVPTDGWPRHAQLLVALIASVTPGTFLLHIDEEPPRLRLHVLDASDPEAVVAQVDRLYRRRVRPLVR